MIYPSENEVLQAIKDENMYSLGKWSRFLPAPETPAQTKIMQLLWVAFQKLGGFTPELSKRVGWNQR